MAKTQKRYGIAAHPDYRLWANMKNRCSNPNHPNYQNYGAKGIKVCQRWQSFELFNQDMEDRPTLKHSIDRIDVEGDYEPTNCRWLTHKEQQNNKRNNKFLTFQKRSQTIAQWSKETGLNHQTISSRLKRGWTIEEALTTLPHQSINQNKPNEVKGVYWYERTGKWKAEINVNRKTKYLGYFKNKEDAIAARKKAELRNRTPATAA